MRLFKPLETLMKIREHLVGTRLLETPADFKLDDREQVLRPSRGLSGH